VRIARLVAERADLDLLADLMDPQMLDVARNHLKLEDWDRRELERLDGRAGALEPLRAAIAKRGAKIEQETLQRELESKIGLLLTQADPRAATAA
jgi:hypothetical protein